MPIIQIWGVPDFIREEDLIPLMADIKREVADIHALGLMENQITVFFPRDRVQEGLGEEIIIFVKGLFDKVERTVEVRSGLAKKLIDRCCSFFPQHLTNKFLVECFLDEPFHQSSGFAAKTMSAAKTR